MSDELQMIWKEPVETQPRNCRVIRLQELNRSRANPSTSRESNQGSYRTQFPTVAVTPTCPVGECIEPHAAGRHGLSSDLRACSSQGKNRHRRSWLTSFACCPIRPKLRTENAMRDRRKEVYGRITSTKSLSLCMTTFRASPTKRTALQPQSSDCCCYVSRVTLAIPPL
jgi:hypothetical protein